MGLACNPGELRTAVRGRHLGKHGRFGLYLVTQRHRAATAPGLAQLLGSPLRPGESAVLAGTVPAGTRILIRSVSGRWASTALFGHVGPFRGKAIISVRRGRSGYPRVFLTRNGDRISPTSAIRSRRPQMRRH